MDLLQSYLSYTYVFKSRLFYVFHSSLNVIVSIQIKISVFAVALNVFKQRRSYLIFCCQMNDEGMNGKS